MEKFKPQDTSREGNVPRRSLSDFVNYKNFLENKYPKLHTEYRLITVDGVDGCGKSYVSEAIASELRKKFGDDQVVIVDITHFQGTLGQEKIGQEREKRKREKNKLPLNDSFAYMSTVNRAYNEAIWPLLEQDKIVIVPRSELNLIRYSIEHSDKNPEMMKNEMQTLLSGAMTHKLFAGNRIFINVTPEDQLTMLELRGENSEYDPSNIDESKSMVESQNEIFDFTKVIPVDKEVNVIKVDTYPTESKELFRGSVLEAVKKFIIPNLKYE